MYEDTCSTISGGERLAEPRECPLFRLGRPLQEASRAPPQQHEHRFLREVLLPRLFHSRRRVQVRRDDHLRYAENVSVIADNRVIREYNDAHLVLEIGYKDCANQARKLSRRYCQKVGAYGPHLFRVESGRKEGLAAQFVFSVFSVFQSPQENRG